MMLVSLLALVLLAAVAPLLYRVGSHYAGMAMAAVPLGLGCWFATHFKTVTGGGEILESWRWLDSLGVTMSLRLDGLSFIFALLICFVGGLVLLYASSYMKGHPRAGVFMATLTGFMAAMLGLVLADNVILLFIFWELTSITSFLLIGFDYDRESARKSALQALLVTGLGGLALLAGLIMLGLAARSEGLGEDGFRLGAILSMSLRDHAWYPPIVILILLGAFTKSAIFPFHFWLPNAMEAPSPVSALLHSATMVKAGVYLVARMHPSLSGTPMWDDVLIVFGGVTMLFAAFIATRQDEFKKILAYSTVSSLGTLVMFIGMNAPKAAAAYLLSHALFKGCLFLFAGTVIKKTGSKYPEKLGGLARKAPITTISALLAGLSMAGMVPLLGFAAKELLLKAGISHPHWAIPATIATALAGTLTVTAALMVAFRPMLGRAGADGGEPTKFKGPVSWRMLAGPAILAVAGLVGGLAPALFAKPLIASVAMSIMGSGETPEVKMDVMYLLWPPTLATWLSFAALALGTCLYLVRRRYRTIGGDFRGLDPIGPAKLYWRFFAGLMGLAAMQTRVLQNGSLRTYVRVTVLTAVGVGVAGLVRTDALSNLTHQKSEVTPLDLVLIGALVLGAIASTLQKTALAAVAVLGSVGFAVAIVFGLYGAPDVAMTQFAVETLVVIIFVLVIFHLPKFSNYSDIRQRLRDALVASSLGVLMGLMTYVMMTRDRAEPVSEAMAAMSMPEAYGRNVVNVILVDFRAMDTLGEIFVVGVAAVGVFTLLRLRMGRPAQIEAVSEVSGDVAGADASGGEDRA